MKNFVAGALAALAWAAVLGWLFMLTVGVIRSEWLPDLPTIGYGPAVLVVGLVSGVVGMMRGTPSVPSD
ncbi:hypothetical protein GA0070616_4624 [Micromonospora nigra]|uniref:Uncharacterized protein n=1 Tax=Micromonospora nigra TaxID=145857 RepID=A0A1C6SUK5_9ACTN|nr:hypothetical protein [Micromonospora nigra]SCL33059.1 hypothetical protein GA0070616_4624 [Micromonospora nigra]